MSFNCTGLYVPTCYSWPCRNKASYQKQNMVPYLFKNRTPISPRKFERYQTTKEMLINSERPFCCNAFHISLEAHCGCRSNKLRPSIKISAWRSYDLFNLYSIRAIFIKYRSFLCDVPIFKMAKLFYCFFPLFIGFEGDIMFY